MTSGITRSGDVEARACSTGSEPRKVAARAPGRGVRPPGDAIDTRSVSSYTRRGSSAVRIPEETMLDVQNPEINVDEIMQRIQEKVRRRGQAAPPQVGMGAPVPAESSLIFNQLLAQARETAQVGVTVPPMSRTHGLKRRLATSVAKAFLRLAQLITRDQRTFNDTAVAA